MDDYVLLDASHLGAEIVEAKIPDIADFCRTYLAIDPANEPMPVQPTAHYAMGGIPTDVEGQVTTGKTSYAGLYAAGECACVSVHGANRLGTNSLVDLIVFGRRAGKHIADYVKNTDSGSIPGGIEKAWEERVHKLKTEKGDMPGNYYKRMQDIMMRKIGVYREGSEMAEAVKEIKKLREEYREIRVQDSSKNFNMEVLSILELENLLDLSLHTAAAALNRQESRGAHSRNDFPERDDTKWLKHALTLIKNGKVEIDYKPVDISSWKPKPRKY
jgi:succinate dehydrogenase / fumarate reductase flavoprotein subunit